MVKRRITDGHYSISMALSRSGVCRTAVLDMRRKMHVSGVATANPYHVNNQLAATGNAFDAAFPGLQKKRLIRRAGKSDALFNR